MIQTIITKYKGWKSVALILASGDVVGLAAERGLAPAPLHAGVWTPEDVLICLLLCLLVLSLI